MSTSQHVSFHNAANPLPNNSLLTGQPLMPLLPPLVGFNDDVVDPNSAVATTLIATAAVKTTAVETSAITTNKQQ